MQRSGSGPDPFSSAVRATRMPMLITDPRQPDNPIVFANAAFARLTGFGRDEILGRNCRFLQGPATDRTDVARLRAAIEARVPIELELLNYKKDGTTFWNRLLVSPVFGVDGELTYFFASQFDVTLERERLVLLQRDRDELEAEVALRSAELQASEERLRLALEAGRLGSWSVNLDTGWLTASDGCKAICGRAPDDPLSLEELRETIHPDDRALQKEAMERAIAEGTLLDAEYRLVLPSGEERWVQIRGQAHYRADGSPLLITGTTQDITDRRRVQSHRALLAREMGHRVKNTLTSLRAVVSQTLRRAKSLDEAGRTLTSRIQAMATANDLLLKEDFRSAAMDDLVTHTLAPFGVEDAERFHVSGPAVTLPPAAVSAFALALHELATNATKYGALSNEAGVVEIRWSVRRGKVARDLEVVWTESGGPPVSPPTETSFGTQLIQRVLAIEIEGSAEIDYRREGVVFTAVAKLENDGLRRRGPSRSPYGPDNGAAARGP
ncbi:PAS domain-containing protein [uncultured Aureimonas sp.]|uniref:PAS domain-containing protein n=1 Tax=uncultured Aureimonas sp. TaxID=1604662 RepID=UPI0025E67753|nr:PAS domain-containing protein [uncultured Aureimonas sp.]